MLSASLRGRTVSLRGRIEKPTSPSCSSVLKTYSACKNGQFSQRLVVKNNVFVRSIEIGLKIGQIVTNISI